MAKRKRTRLTDSERVITKAVDKRDWFKEDSTWFQEQIEAKKDKIDPKLLEEIKQEARDRNSLDSDSLNEDEEKKKNRRSPIYHIKDICKVLDWQFPRDKIVRNKLAGFANQLQVSQGANSGEMLWNGMMAVITRPHFEDATDMFLSKKEAQKGRKRRKREAKVGEREIRVPMTEEEKKAARKERSRIRRKAQKLGITTDEVKKLEAEEVTKPKEETKKKVTRKKTTSTKKKTKKKTTKKSEAA